VQAAQREFQKITTMGFSGWKEAFARDISYTFRQFWRNPVFTLVAVVSLAIGIGANTAIFSIMNQVVLRSLPVRDPNQLIIATDPNAGGVAVGMLPGVRKLLSYVEFAYLRDHATTLSGMCAAESEPNRRQVRIGGESPETANARLVSENYFSVLGVEPVIGRLFAADDAKGPGQDPYVVLSYDYWQRRFGRNPGVIGAPIRMYGATLNIIGVAPRGFQGTSVSDRPDFWVPMMMQPLVVPGRDWLHEDLSQSLEKVMWLHVFGRLKPNMNLARAQSELDVLFRNLLEAGYPAILAPATRKKALNQRLILHAAGTGTFIGRSELQQQLLILLAVSLLVLLIACANVANLLMARTMARNKEVCVRLSIGASRSRLVRQFLTESLVLALSGGLAGLLLAWGGGHLLVVLLSDPQNPLQLSNRLDLHVLGFTAAVSLLTGIVFGLAPALRGTQVEINAGLRETGRGVTGSAGRLNLARCLVVAQVAVSLLLLVGAGLFLRTLWKLQAIDLGYAKEKLLVITVDGVTAGYKDVRLANLWHDLADRIGQVPGVSGVAYSMNGLIGGAESADEIDVEGFTPQRDNERFSRFDMVGPGYFSTIGIPLIMGREIGVQDTSSAPHVCVINEAFARLFFAGRNPMGAHVTEKFGDKKNVMEVVGVSRDVRDRNLRGNIPPRFYVAMDQGMDGPSPWAMFEIRTVADERQIVGAARKSIFAVNQDLPIEDVRSLQESLDRTNLQPHMIASLCVIFGSVALLLAAMGLYGVLSYGVTRRTNEIGIRMALGAGRGRVMRLILWEMGVMIAIGIGLGAILTAAGTRFVASRLYGLTALDPLTILSAVGILCFVAVIAAALPALRAARVNPMKALRYE
jgi:putative ABC transport system permease protein